MRKEPILQRTKAPGSCRVGGLGSSSNRFPGTEQSGQLAHAGTFIPLASNWGSASHSRCPGGRAALSYLTRSMGWYL